jgi:hypothetical protein
LWINYDMAPRKLGYFGGLDLGAAGSWRFWGDL